jgi:DNA-binding NtrC family response regulator
VAKILGGLILSSATMSASKPLALIIEDDHGSAEALALILSDWGAEVAHGIDSDGAEAALGDRADEVRWIITDFHLGRGPDGITLVKRLTQSAPQARVLVLSGSFHGRATDAAAEAGFEVMQKPARAEAIVAWLERA